MLQIPLSAVPSQSLSVVLGNQNCQISLYTLTTGLYFDLLVNGAPIATTVRCENLARMLEDAQYRGFIGDFVFIDVFAANTVVDGVDPVYTGLGTQFQLEYLEATDLAVI